MARAFALAWWLCVAADAEGQPEHGSWQGHAAQHGRGQGPRQSPGCGGCCYRSGRCGCSCGCFSRCGARAAAAAPQHLCTPLPALWPCAHAHPDPTQGPAGQCAVGSSIWLKACSQGSVGFGRYASAL